MEIVNSFRCQEIILGIDNLESTHSLLKPVGEKGSTLHYELFFLGVIDDLLYIFSCESIVVENRSNEDPYTSSIDDNFVKLSIEGLFKNNFVFWINLNKHLECVDCSINAQPQI
jgi:hypothetical protein